MNLPKKLISFLILAGFLVACQLVTPAPPALPPTATPSPAPSRTPPSNASLPTAASLPQTDAEVPRVSPQDAKAAFDAGEAVIVDVRSVDVYNAEHAVGAISVPLADIEANPGGVPLDKSKWIITYCT